MARQQIELGINTTYSGEGFKKLNAALKQSSGQVTRVSSSVSNVMDKLGGLDGAAGKTVGAIGKLAGSFAHGGVFGVAMGLASTAVGFLVGKFNEAKETARKFADVMRNEVAAAFGDIEAKSKKMMDALEKSNRAISAGAARANAAVSRDAGTRISNLRTSTAEATRNAPESFRKGLEAQERLEAATIRADAEVKKAENSAEALRKIAENSAKAKADADAAVVKAEEEEASVRQKATEYLLKRRKAEDAIMNAMSGYGDTIRDQKVVFKETAKARLKLKELEEQYAGDIKLLKDASEKVASVRALAKAADEKLNDANARLNDATDDLSAAQKKRAADISTATQALNDFQAAEKKSWAEFLEAQKKRLKDAEDAHAAEMKELSDKEADAKKRRDAEDKILKMREDGAKKIAEIDAQIAEAKKEAVRLEENAKRARGVGFGDWQRGERNRAREERTNKGRQQRRMDRDFKELERLERMNPRAMSEFDKKKLGKLREWKADQNPKNNPALNAQKNLEQKRDRLQREQATAIKQIRDALVGGGLNI